MADYYFSKRENYAHVCVNTIKATIACGIIVKLYNHYFDCTNMIL